MKISCSTQTHSIWGSCNSHRSAIFGTYRYYGITQNSAEAVKWYRKPAEQGYVKAQFTLGECYYNGDGVAKDYAEAVKWWKKSAEQGHANAQSKLGLCYYIGNGVKKDRAEALKWYRKSAEQGEQRAKEALQRIGETW